jgi:protein TonB
VSRGGPHGARAALAIPGDSGDAGEATAEYAGYLRQLRSQIQGSITYPAAARQRGLSGTVLVEIVLQPSGQIERVSLLASSSHEALDRGALDTVRAMRPLPFPPGLPHRPLRVELPIVFELR